VLCSVRIGFGCYQTGGVIEQDCLADFLLCQVPYLLLVLMCGRYMRNVETPHESLAFRFCRLLLSGLCGSLLRPFPIQTRAKRLDLCRLVCVHSRVFLSGRGVWALQCGNQSRYQGASRISTCSLCVLLLILLLGQFVCPKQGYT
jgi:hypothetical protein